jgi:organic radical activating enzyme
LINQTQCNLKGNHKVFFLQLDQASSCCRSYPELLPANLPTLLYQWQLEHDQLSQGIPVQNCSVCWKDQAHNHISYRQKNGHNKTNTIELSVDNSCNQMCSYCSPKFSSTWARNMIVNGPFENVSCSFKDNLALTPQMTDQSIWLEEIKDYLQDQPPNSVVLSLLGGEPLMQYKNLQTLIDLCKDSVAQLSITTNLNPPHSRFLHWILENLPQHKLMFDISLDSTPAYNHVPRAGFNRKRFESNFQLLQDKNIPFRILSVVSVLGIFDLPKFVNWSKSYQVIFNKINNPDCLDPVLLPNHILDQIADQFVQKPPDFFQELYKKPSHTLDLKLFEQYNYLCQYFLRTDIDPVKIENSVFQQYWKWLIEKNL